MSKTVKRLLSMMLTIILIFGVLGITASAANEEGFPFLLGAAKNRNNKPAPLLSYTLGENPGTVPMTGTVINYPLKEAFAQFNTYPDSDHPDGTAYFWVYNDAQNLYFICDWTSDDTYDDGDDYFSVHLNDGIGVKTYTQTSDGGNYGQALFGMTDTADFRHMYYIIAVPLSDLNSDSIRVGFELYGTASVSANINWKAPSPPATAVAGEDVDFTVEYEITNQTRIANRLYLLEYTDDEALSDFLTRFDCIENDSICEYVSQVGFVPYTGTDVTVLGYEVFDETGGDGIGEVTVSSSFAVGTHKLAVMPYFLYSENTEDAYGYAWNCSALTAEITVLGITGIPSTMNVGSLELDTYCEPEEGEAYYESKIWEFADSDLAYQHIDWSVADAGTTGATIETETETSYVYIDGELLQASETVSTLSAPSAGTLVLRATITDGLGAGENYTQDFTITVTDGSGYIPPMYYTVTFYSRGGSAVNSQQLSYGSKVLKPDDPRREFCRFKGWYTDAGCREPYDFDEPVSGSFTLYAGWELKIRFNDIKPSDWFYGDVMFAVENGLMNGIVPESFSPDLYTSRAMIVTMLWRLAEEPAPTGVNVFPDVRSGSYYEKAVIWAAEKKIAKGYEDGRFGPDESISREELVTLLYRYAGSPELTAGQLEFSDASDVSDWAFDAFVWATSNGIVNGRSDGLLDPKGFATRAESAAIMHRFCEM